MTEVDDVHADAVIDELQARNVPVLRLNTHEFPAVVGISLELTPEGARGSIATPYRSVALERIGAAWLRRPRDPEPAPGTPPAAVPYVVRQCTDLLAGLFATLDATWVGEPIRLRRAENKALQLLHARAAGLAVPATLMSNDPAACARFEAEHAPAGLAVKPFTMVAMERGDARVFPRTTRVEPGRPLDGVELAPSIFQPYVEKAFELRCVVIGERVFAVAIHSQEDPDTVEDWRIGEARQTPHDLPGPVADRLLTLVRSFGLAFAAIDLVVTPEGEHVFLDLNPNGQYLWLEADLGLPLSAAMADLLCASLERVPAAS